MCHTCSEALTSSNDLHYNVCLRFRGTFNSDSFDPRTVDPIRPLCDRRPRPFGRDHAPLRQIRPKRSSESRRQNGHGGQGDGATFFAVRLFMK